MILSLKQRRYFSILWTFLFSIPSALCANYDENTRTVLASYYKAIGGNNWSKVESVRLTGQIEQKGKTIDFVQVKKRPNLLRTTLTFSSGSSLENNLQLVFATNREGVWSAKKSGSNHLVNVQEIKGEQAISIKEEAIVTPLLMSLYKNGHPLALEKNTRIFGEPALVIRSAPTNTESSYLFYLSKQTYLPLGHKREDKNGDIVTSQIIRYETVDNLNIPVETLLTHSKVGQTKMEVANIKIGVGIYDDYFHLQANHSPQLNP